MFSNFVLVGMLPNLPAKEDKTKNSIARLFEDWWKKNLQQRDDMIVTTLVYLVQRSLDLEPKPLVIMAVKSKYEY